ncbi:hypothetical protein CDAR_552801 [Caerostris darwini]|uniref:Uncharacterized protein n=1 Tax=Caerostris darwini TaxID=1538125 RepID=A0AAV4TJ68_9ARAC|nr:hypothetical protein CDAR_552801 [Caerostris darwini]
MAFIPENCVLHTPFVKRLQLWACRPFFPLDNPNFRRRNITFPHVSNPLKVKINNSLSAICQTLTLRNKNYDVTSRRVARSVNLIPCHLEEEGFVPERMSSCVFEALMMRYSLLKRPYLLIYDRGNSDPINSGGKVVIYWSLGVLLRA